MSFLCSEPKRNNISIASRLSGRSKSNSYPICMYVVQYMHTFTQQGLKGKPIFSNVLILYGHCPNSVRPPSPPPTMGQNR